MAMLSGCLFGQSNSHNSSLIDTSIDAITNLTSGLSLEEVQMRFSVKLTHEFTAGIESNRFLCVRLCHVQKSYFFYLLFRNDGFQGVIEEPRLGYEKYINSRGWASSRPKPTDSEAAMQAVLNRPQLSAAEIQQLVDKWARAAKEAAVGKEPEKIQPAFKLTDSVLQLKKPAITKARLQAIELIDKFNPLKVKIGMTPMNVESVLGAPNHSQTEGNQTVAVYGTRLPEEATEPIALEGPAPSESGDLFLAVFFKEGKAIRVFSHELFDKRLLKKTRP